MELGERVAKVETALDMHVKECAAKHAESIRREDKRFRVSLGIALTILTIVASQLFV